mmetsp:Transcript_65255/g.164474  ORF Transcript_65255/g.164474 Transcript_65255/m.164474 type:complete len:521 (-) Transcript_65255:212-1774(-)
MVSRKHLVDLPRLAYCRRGIRDACKAVHLLDGAPEQPGAACKHVLALQGVWVGAVHLLCTHIAHLSDGARHARVADVDLGWAITIVCLLHAIVQDGRARGGQEPSDGCHEHVRAVRIQPQEARPVMQLDHCPQVCIWRSALLGHNLGHQDLAGPRAEVVLDALGFLIAPERIARGTAHVKVVQGSKARGWEARVGQVGALQVEHAPCQGQGHLAMLLRILWVRHHPAQAQCLPRFLPGRLLSDDQEVGLAELHRIRPELGGQVGDEIRSHMLCSVEPQAVHISEGHPILEQVGEDLLPILILRVVIKHAFHKVAEDRCSRLPGGVRDVVGPTTIEKGRGPEGREEAGGEVHAHTRSVVSRSVPIHVVPAICAWLMFRRACIRRRRVANMVDHDVKHDCDAVPVSVSHQIPQLLRRTEAWVRGCWIRVAIPMIATVIHQHRSDPQGLDAQVLQVAQTVPDALQVTPMPPIRHTGPVVACHRILLCLRHVCQVIGQVAIVEAISHDLVHHDAGPRVRGRLPG